MVRDMPLIPLVWNFERLCRIKNLMLAKAFCTCSYTRSKRATLANMSRKPTPSNPTKPKAAVTAKAREARSVINERDDKRWRAFAREYVKDFNGTRAAIEVGYAKKSAAMQASRLLTKDKVQEFILQANRRIWEKAELDGVAVVRKLGDMLMADPRELVEVHVGCCRYCYGIANKHQYTWGELTAKQEAWLDEGRPIEKFDEKGGGGYNAAQLPNGECPECLGQGVARSIVKDTRKLSPGAAALFAGVKVTDSGRVVTQMHSQLDVSEKLMKHYGMYEKDNKQKGGLLGDLPPRMIVEFVDPPARAHDPLKDKGGKV